MTRVSITKYAHRITDRLASFTVYAPDKYKPSELRVEIKTGLGNESMNMTAETIDEAINALNHMKKLLK